MRKITQQKIEGRKLMQEDYSMNEKRF